jgi:23S rRNA (adenine2030-N6)-methyltransferase
MNYRHAFHAGNFADVHKHWVLTLLLERLCAKDKPFFVLDSHAGAGFYDLAREETERTGEAAQGIARFLDAEPLPDCFEAYAKTIRDLNPDGGLRWYPGSPWLVAQALRPGDRFIAVEAHPEEARLLRETLRQTRVAQVLQRDGYTVIPSTLPPKERRGLVLIDPPYETPDEIARIVKAVVDGMVRFPSASVAIWYPIKTRALGDVLTHKLSEALPATDRGRLRCEVWVTAPDREEAGLTGSGLLLLNPIWPMEETLNIGMPSLAHILGQDAQAGSRVDRF